ncbi:type VII toxin-antitoxin system MntA family adenylyltransferase antitoxin [Bacillus smithii]|uniref:type VII toxin-antitoxin system MntA family adenylyltransferase antitoxin n=1 Tax=Bacillus smithii TaxID=1479 RepID=UPI003D1F1CA7
MKRSERERILKLLKDIVLDTLDDVSAKVYLFGSWAREEEKRTSDIDIGLLSKEDIPIRKWVELRERIEESCLPYRVDVVDLSKANTVLVEKVKREGILWRDYTNDSSSQTKH